MKLSGITILITRASSQAGRFAELIRLTGGTPIIFPTIEILPTKSWSDCDRAISRLYMYDGIIFTSVNGVDYFYQRVKESNISYESLASKIVFAVGEKTRQRIEQYGVKVTIVPEKYTAQDLAYTIQQENLQGKTFLFPKGNISKDTLPAMLRLLGANVDEVEVYRTCQPKSENVSHIEELFANDGIDVITFMSPSTVKSFFNLISKNKLTDHVKLAVIGPTTAAAVRELELEVAIQPTQSTIENLINSIENYFGFNPKK